MTEDKVAYNGMDPPAESPAESPNTTPEPTDVVVTFKKPQPVQVEIDPDKLLWEDMQMVRRIQNDQATEEEAGEMFMDLLTKLTGQDARKMPMRVINSVIAQLGKIAGEDDGEEEDEEKKASD